MQHRTLASFALAALASLAAALAPSAASALPPTHRRAPARLASGPAATARPRAVRPPAPPAPARQRAECLGAVAAFDVARPTASPYAAMTDAAPAAPREEAPAAAGAGAGATDAPVPAALSLRGHDGAAPTHYGVWVTWEADDRPAHAPAPRPAR